jgi:hypothetical protein
MPRTGDNARQHGQQLFRQIEIALIAGLVERGEDVVRYAPGATTYLVGRRVGGRIAHSACQTLRRDRWEKKARAAGDGSGAQLDPSWIASLIWDSSSALTVPVSLRAW